MDNEKVDEALRSCARAIAYHVEQQNLPHWGDMQPQPSRLAIDGPTRLRHLTWMIGEALSWSAERIEKKFRWLGFIQGVLWSEEISSIDELKQMNVPHAQAHE